MTYTGSTNVPDLPPRLTTPEVLELARYGRAKLRAQRKAGRMPDPIDRGGDGDIYDRDAVFKALGIAQDDKQSTASPWIVDPDVLREAFARPLRKAERDRR